MQIPLLANDKDNDTSGNDTDKAKALSANNSVKPNDDDGSNCCSTPKSVGGKEIVNGTVRKAEFTNASPI